MFQSVMFALNAVLSTLPLWTDSALVVDCGHSETTAVAVFDGVAAVSTFVAVSAGASEIHTQIWAALKDANADHADAIDALNERVLEDVKIRACIAGKLPEGSELPSLKCPLRGGPTLTVTSPQTPPRSRSCVLAEWKWDDPPFVERLCDPSSSLSRSLDVAIGMTTNLLCAARWHTAGDRTGSHLRGCWRRRELDPVGDPGRVVGVPSRQSQE